MSEEHKDEPNYAAFCAATEQYQKQCRTIGYGVVIFSAPDFVPVADISFSVEQIKHPGLAEIITAFGQIR